MEEKEKKTAEKKKAKNEKKFFDGVKAEYKKIVWPSRKDAVKSTGAVVVTAIVSGLFIAMLDTAIKFGLGFII